MEYNKKKNSLGLEWGSAGRVLTEHAQGLGPLPAAHDPGVVVYACNSGTQESRNRRIGEFRVTLGYLVNFWIAWVT